MLGLTAIAAGASFRASKTGIDPGAGCGLGELESAGHADPSEFFAGGIVRGKQGVRVVVVGHDVERDADSPGCRVDRDVLVQPCMKLLHLALPEFAGGLDQGVECRGIKRFRILLVAPHGPGADQGGFGFPVHDHLDGPALVVFVLDDARCPAVAAPKSRFPDQIGGICPNGVVRCSRCHGRILSPATTRNCSYRSVSRSALAEILWMVGCARFFMRYILDIYAIRSVP